MQKKMTVLVVDDHLAIRKGLGAMLAEDADIEVVGEACTGEDAILRVQELGPQVVWILVCLASAVLRQPAR